MERGGELRRRHGLGNRRLAHTLPPAGKGLVGAVRISSPDSLQRVSEVSLIVVVSHRRNPSRSPVIEREKGGGDTGRSPCPPPPNSAAHRCTTCEKAPSTWFCTSHDTAQPQIGVKLKRVFFPRCGSQDRSLVCGFAGVHPGTAEISLIHSCTSIIG